MGPASYGGGGAVNIDAAIENPDYIVFEKAYGFRAERAGETGQFAAAIERVRAAGGGVIELMIDPEALTPRATLSQIRAAGLAR